MRRILFCDDDAGTCSATSVNAASAEEEEEELKGREKMCGDEEDEESSNQGEHNIGEVDEVSWVWRCVRVRGLAKVHKTFLQYKGEGDEV